MIMNFVLYRKIYPVSKYIVVFLTTVGVSSFMLLQPVKPGKSSATSSLYGIFLLSINLLIDGATNSTQDHMFKRHNVTGTSMMVMLNLISSVLMFVYLLVNPYSTELFDAVRFCIAHPALLQDILIFGLCGALGQCFIYHTLSNYGSLVLVTVTVTRKMFSILLSVLYFGHRLKLAQWGSVALVFSGIIYESSSKKHHEKKEEAPPKEGRSTPRKANAVGILKNTSVRQSPRLRAKMKAME
jgi:UDP-galactose transporter B1